MKTHFILRHVSIRIGLILLTLGLSQCTHGYRVLDRQQINYGGRTFVQERFVVSEDPLETGIVSRMVQ